MRILLNGLDIDEISVESWGKADEEFQCIAVNFLENEKQIRKLDVLRLATSESKNDEDYKLNIEVGNINKIIQLKGKDLKVKVFTNHPIGVPKPGKRGAMSKFILTFKDKDIMDSLLNAIEQWYPKLIKVTRG